MDHEPSPPARTSSPLKVDEDYPPPLMQSREQDDEESSSDDVPVRQRRPVRGPAHDRDSGYDLRDHPKLEDPGSEATVQPLLEERRAAQQSARRKPPKTTIVASSKAPKKPGPLPWATKPIRKNDMEAKKVLIREIESYWGKGFIKAYIPKCHRPLVKREKGGKHVVYRSHEADPKNWLPSVLKSILSISKLTQNKAWLKKAMNDVVRYRIKNTGNRKPQLVTTDFDVLEDLLVNNWEIPYSFTIRYKHLLVNRQGQQETDEDIDHILGVGAGNEIDSDEEIGDVEDSDNDEMIVKEEDDEGTSRDALTGQDLQASGYISAPQYPPPYPMPSLPPQKLKSRAGSELPSRPQPPPGRGIQHGYGAPYPYGPSMDPWGRPIPYGGGHHGFGGYGGYGMYGGYGAHVPSVERDGRQSSQASRYYGYPPIHMMPPSPFQPDTKPAHHQHLQNPTSPDSNTRNESAKSSFPMSLPGYHPYGYAQDIQHNNQPELKQESSNADIHGKEREMSTDESELPTNSIGDDSSAAALEAELRATELELKVARLQARRAALSAQAKGQ